MVWDEGARNASRGRGRVGRKKGGRSRVGKGKRALTKPRGKRAASAAAGPVPAAAGGPAAGGSADRAPQEQEEQAGELPDVQWGQDAGVKASALATRFERAHRQALEATGCSIYPSNTEEVHIQAPRTEVPYIISSDLTDKENYEKPISVMLSPNGATVFQDTQVRVFSTQRPRETSGGTKPGRHRAQPRWGKETGDAQSVLFIPEAFSPEQADAIAEKLHSAVKHPSNQANIISPIKIDGKLVSIPLGPGVVQTAFGIRRRDYGKNGHIGWYKSNCSKDPVVLAALTVATEIVQGMWKWMVIADPDKAARMTKETDALEGLHPGLYCFPGTRIQTLFVGNSLHGYHRDGRNRELTAAAWFHTNRAQDRNGKTIPLEGGHLYFPDLSVAFGGGHGQMCVFDGNETHAATKVSCASCVAAVRYYCSPPTLLHSFLSQYIGVGQRLVCSGYNNIDVAPIKSGINKGKLPKVDTTLLPPLLSEVAAKVGITLSKVKVGTNCKRSKRVRIVD